MKQLIKKLFTREKTIIDEVCLLIENHKFNKSDLSQYYLHIKKCFLRPELFSAKHKDKLIEFITEEIFGEFNFIIYLYIDKQRQYISEKEINKMFKSLNCTYCPNYKIHRGRY